MVDPEGVELVWWTRQGTVSGETEELSIVCGVFEDDMFGVVWEMSELAIVEEIENLRAGNQCKMVVWRSNEKQVTYLMSLPCLYHKILILYLGTQLEWSS